MRAVRRVAIVLMAVGLVTAAMYATGAFSSMTASRNAQIDVVGDASGYLGLRPASGPNGAYAKQDASGNLRVVLGKVATASGTTGEGLNPDAVTTVDNVFTITNQGPRTVGLWLTDGGGAVTFRVGEQSIEGKTNAIPIAPGTTKKVSLVVDTRRVSTDEDLLRAVTFHASTNVTGTHVQSESGDESHSSSTTPSPSTPPSPADAQTESTATPTTHRTAPPAEPTPKATQKKNAGLQLDAGYILKAFIGGMGLGNLAMPGGPLEMKESESPFFLLGQLLMAFAPGPFDILADARDLGANIISGKTFTAETFLNALSLVPVIGKVDDLKDAPKIVSKWLDAFPKQADAVVEIFSKVLIKHLPGSLGAKMLELVSGVPASKLSNKGIPMDDILKYQDDGVDFKRVLELRNKDVSPEDIRYYVENDIDLGLVSRLRDEGMKPQRIRFRLGDGSKKSISTLRSQGLNREEIVHLIDEGADLKTVTELREKGFSMTQINHFVDEGADLKEVSNVWSKDVPYADIKYYVDNDISLSGVRKLREIGVPTGVAKKMLSVIKTADNVDKKAVDEMTTRTINKNLEGDYRISKPALEIAKAAVNTKNWKEARQEIQDEKNELSDESIQHSIGNSFKVVPHH